MSRANLRLEVLNAYGGPICICCGERELMFLTLDHARNDGAAFRKELEARKGRKINMDLYRVLKAEGFPQDRGIRVLCWNCNCGRARNQGICPHEEKRIGTKWVNRQRLTTEDVEFIKAQKGSKGPRNRAHTRLSLHELSFRYGISPASLFKIQNEIPTKFDPSEA